MRSLFRPDSASFGYGRIGQIMREIGHCFCLRLILEFEAMESFCNSDKGSVPGAWKGFRRGDLDQNAPLTGHADVFAVSVVFSGIRR